MLALQSAIGVVVIPLLVWLLSEERRALTPIGALRLIAVGLACQFALAALLLTMPWTQAVFEALAGVVTALQGATDAGVRLVFGYLGGGPAPFDVARPENSFILAFRVLPMILVLSAIVRLLYYWGVLQRVVRAFAWALTKTFGIGGPLSTAAAANVILGMVEAPLMIRPYLADMGRGALFATMAVGMATVAGTVMAIYASVLTPVLPGAAGHLISASLINVPGALLLARLAVPSGFNEASPAATVAAPGAPSSSMDAIAQGTGDGIKLVASVAAMLIVMVSLVALINTMLSAIGPVAGEAITLQRLLGVVAMPLAFIIGIPWGEAATAGSLIGQKVILNEFLAYLELVRTPEGELSARSRLLLTYALCGFANLGSVGILVGGLTVMVPERRVEVVALAPRAMVVGFLTTLLSASVIGVMHWS